MQIEVIKKQIPKPLSYISLLIDVFQLFDTVLFMDENETCSSRFMFLVHLVNVNTY